METNSLEFPPTFRCKLFQLDTMSSWEDKGIGYPIVEEKVIFVHQVSIFRMKSGF